MEIKRVMVVGAGFMGSGIAQVFAASGHEVVLGDMTEELALQGRRAVERNASAAVAKGKMSAAQKEELLSRISAAASLERAEGCDFVIEAITEDKRAKKGLFADLEGFCRPEVILASNTSSLPITELAAATGRPERFIGMHFFSPAPVMKLVEIVPGLRTSQETVTAVKGLAARLGKVGILVKDGPGFLVNRVNAALRSEVYACLAEGVASLEDIDTALKLGLGHPMGPFELQDLVGLDVGLAVMETLWENFKDPKWRPALILKKLVVAGDLGRKTGKGWYDYTSGEKRPRTDVNW